ncbi:hypothetical protein RJ639_018770 [Escallonia herrerae]|uniref:Uncharacterized protein n=1 Tax=Escallonia herrerae TaxID=1293975 RepID=A0AA89AI40_9ASTE|nr:hypothetical protein RJ639_018770 [Escallonia herrerae]
MVLEFITDIFVLIARSLALAIFVCVLGCFSFLIYVCGFTLAFTDSMAEWYEFHKFKPHGGGGKLPLRHQFPSATSPLSPPLISVALPHCPSPLSPSPTPLTSITIPLTAVVLPLYPFTSCPNTPANTTAHRTAIHRPPPTVTS